MKGKRCKHQISGQLSKVLEVSQGLCGTGEWGGVEGTNTQGETRSSWSSRSFPPPLGCSQREPRDEHPKTLDGFQEGCQVNLALLPPRHPAFSLVLRASTELRHLPRSCEVPRTTVTGREKKEKDIIAAINH